MKRIHIVGGPASGKTALAMRIAARIGAPAYALNDLAYDMETGVRNTLTVRLEGARQIAAQPEWVTAGFYLYWTEDLMRAADAIVWLDRPMWSAALRQVFARRRGPAGRRSPIAAPYGFAWLRAYYRAREYDQIGPPDDDYSITRRATAEQLARHGARVVRCRSAAQVRRFVASLQAN